MTDLDAAIRERLDGWLDDICGRWRDDCPVEGHSEAIKMRGALTAALDLHKPRWAGIGSKPHVKDCSVCMDIGPEICNPTGYPCETVEAIAKQLGLETNA